MFKKLLLAGLVLCLTCAPAFAQSSYPTASNSYKTRNSSSAYRSGSQSSQYKGSGSQYKGSGSQYKGSNSQYKSSNSSGRTYNVPSYSGSNNYYGSNYSNVKGPSLNIVTPQCPVTQSIVIPATGGYLHTLSCPSVQNSRASYMYAEDAVKRGVRPTGTCPQCRAALASKPTTYENPQQSQMARNAAVREDALRRLDENQHRNRVEKQLKEIEDNRRWDNKMAEWENKQPMYISNPNSGVYVNRGTGCNYGTTSSYNSGWGCNNPYNNSYDDGGRMADVQRTKAIIDANNDAARSQSEQVLRLNGY